MKVHEVTRSEWGADPQHPRLGHQVEPAKRTEVFIHHTVIVDDDVTINEWESLDEVKAQMRRLQTIRPELGLDVPYNFVAFCMADGDLVLGEGRGLSRSGAHTAGHNTSALGIAFHGNFEREPLPAHLDTQLLALAAWLQDLRYRREFTNLGTVQPADPERQVFGHRDVKATACPGKHLFALLWSIRFVTALTWRLPGDQVITAADRQAVLAASGLGGEIAPEHRTALLVDRILQLEERVADLEG